MRSTNVKLTNDFRQVCVWPATEMGEATRKEFVDFFKDDMGVRVKFMEEIVTTPDMKNGNPVPGTGGRHDILFAIHCEDVGKFAVPRLAYGIRWIEDVYSNGGGDIYPARVAEYKTW